MDINKKIEKEEAKRILKENGNRLIEDSSDSFVSLRHINKIYPNGVQAVYDFNLEINPHDFIALVGPSGCGKSTTLRMIAGLEEISSGELFINHIYTNYLPSKDRDIAMVFQSYALYPQLNVYDNIAFGLKMRHIDKKTIEERVYQAADILDLGPYLDRKPKELSGGQMQRVALGRAIVRNAKLFLMDEPLSNLDAKLRVQMRSEIVRIHEQIGATTIYVTHDQTEAMTMATRIAVMSKGWVQQIDEPSVIYNHPNNIFVATFIGSPAMNIFEGTYDNGSLVFDNGYRMKLSDDYKRVHDEFYARKIAQTKELLNKPAVKKMEGIIYLDQLRASLEARGKEKSDSFALNVAERSALERIRGIADNIKNDDMDGELMLSAIDGMDEINHSSVMMVLGKLRHYLYNLTGITSRELGILHNVEAFSKKKKEGKEEVLFYTKRHGKAKKAVSGYKNVIHMKDSSIVLTNNLYVTLTELLAKYESALKEPHSVRVGIRPEHIHLDQEFDNANKSGKFTCQSDVVELLGSELLLHTTFDNKEMVAKIATGTLVKPHEDVDLSFDTDKVLVFDVNSGDTIADWVKAD